MTEQPIEGEIVEEPGTELEVVGPQPATLFHTDNPVEIVQKAGAVADVLTSVLKARGLTSKIGQKEYVQVEGWTLCGTMLGVFAVVEWSRPVDDGWEARATAQNLAGQVVGAAEAECLRSERNWKDRDDYALRSMAQTRAVSKALRAPLGFIVQMAGFAATPADEMPTEQPRPERRQNANAVPAPKSWPKVKDAMRACDNPDEAEALYEAFLRAATYHLYGKTSLKEITAEERKVMLQKAAGAAVWLAEHEDETQDGPFSFYLEPTMRQAWAAMLDGVALEIPDYEPPPAEASAEAEAASYDEEAARLAAKAFADPS